MLFKYKTTDGLKIHRALPGHFLIPLIAAMTFLAALMVAGAYAGQSLAKRWNNGAASTVILQIPETKSTSLPVQNTVTTPNNSPSLQQIITLLSSAQELASFHKLSNDEINQLLAPWLHEDFQSLALPIPAIIELHLKANSNLSEDLKNSLKKINPNIIIEQSNFWSQRLNALANSLQSCAFLALGIVIFVAAAITAIATRTGLIQCRQTIEILHNLGASDHYISSRFAKRSAFLAFIGGCLGSLCSIPLLLFLTYLSLPFSSDPNWQVASQSSLTFLTLLPFKLLVLFLMLPLCNYLIGWLATTSIVYFWLRHLT